jgi:flagellar L-ring protein precursor FlgH
MDTVIMLQRRTPSAPAHRSTYEFECLPSTGIRRLATFAAVVAAVLLLLGVWSASADAQELKDLQQRSPASQSLDQYLARVRAQNSAEQVSFGSLWSNSGRLTRLSTDVRAMRPHDLISVVVDENLAASTDGTVKNSRASNASSGISGLLGTLHAGNALQNLITQSSNAGLNAQGTSQTNSSLSTTLGGQVVDVLPNGMLVIEAARQVDSQQTSFPVRRAWHRPSCQPA